MKLLSDSSDIFLIYACMNASKEVHYIDVAFVWNS